jgi:PKD repeat protein
VITQYAQLCGIDSIKSDTIRVFPIPDVAFSHDLRACVGEEVVFNNLSSAGFVAEWDFGDGHTSGEFAPTHIYDTSGLFTVTLVMYSDFFGCPAIETSIIEIPVEPIADFMPSAMAACPDEPITFTNTSTGAVHFEWNFGDMSGDTTRSAVHRFTNSGEYQVTLIVFDAVGCSSETFMIPVTIFEKPSTEFNLSQLELCFGLDSIFTENNSEGYTSSIWYLNGTIIEEQKADIALGNLAPDDYELRLVSTNAFGCTDEMSRLFTVYPQPLAEFELSDRALCEGDTSGVINLSLDATDYYWTVDGVLLDLIDGNLMIPESGEYEIVLIAENSGVCRDTFTYPFLVKVYDAPIAAFSYIVDQDPNVLGDVEFINLSIDADEYLWDFGDGQLTDEYSPSHEYDINGPVSVCLTATNFNNGEFTCVDKAFELIEFERINRFYAPNGISPDKNFGNDLVAVFKPVGIGVEAYELNVYSPWGDNVATLNQVINEAPADFWDGTYRGEVVPQGTYIWKARIEYTDGDVEVKVGNVTVVR